MCGRPVSFSVHNAEWKENNTKQSLMCTKEEYHAAESHKIVVGGDEYQPEEYSFRSMAVKIKKKKKKTINALSTFRTSENKRVM